MKPARILICAGSDSGGGAGIQADIKTVTALGGYAMTAVTALTAQNTLGVQAILPVPPDFVRAQMRSVLDDLGADAIKTGMLGEAPTVLAVAEMLEALAPNLPLVVDPVMVAKGGAELLSSPAVDALKARLLPRADLLTPNLPEAEILLGRNLPDLASMRQAAQELRQLGARAVLLKGGHLDGAILHDVLASEDGVLVFDSPQSRDAAYARHRLHARFGHRHRLGTKKAAGRGGLARPHLCARRDPGRPRLRPGPRPAQSRLCRRLPIIKSRRAADRTPRPKAEPAA